jgi:hypothetical protein
MACGLTSFLFSIFIKCAASCTKEKKKCVKVQLFSIYDYDNENAPIVYGNFQIYILLNKQDKDITQIQPIVKIY